MNSPRKSYEKSLLWFRRDLRDFDHAALFHALKYSRQVFCVFVFDREILDTLPRQDRRVEFLLGSVAQLQAALRQRGGELLVFHDTARERIARLAKQLEVEAVFCNRDYEPAAIGRDTAVTEQLRQAGIDFLQYKDQVIFEQDEVLTQAGKPFSVFTPYKNAWLKKITAFHVKPYPVDRYANALAAMPPQPLPTLEQLGFEASNLQQLNITPGMSGASQLLQDFLPRIGFYHQSRDFPGVKGVSYLSVHLRFGTTSIRHLAAQAWHGTQAEAGPGHDCWLNELIWRDFYQQILWHFPHVVGNSFKADYANLAFPNNRQHFAAWCEARTGYPIVDAAMRQLNHSGYMHNRLRMIVASFLVKDLLIDWRWGEAYFAEKLLDFDLSANNGGWQWAASTGCDAQPYFRIFNPITQSEKFDPKGSFIRRYLPELAKLPDRYLHAPWLLPPLLQQQLDFVPGQHYPLPIVDHATAREQALALFQRSKASDKQL